MVISGCPACASTSIARSDMSKLSVPYTNLYPIGALRMSKPTNGPFPLCPQCCSSTETEGWYAVLGGSFLRYVCGEESIFVQDIEYLVKHHFIAIEISDSQRDILVRLYLVPYDLPGWGGQLMKRKRSIITRAQISLRRILKDLKDWNEVASSQTVLPSEIDNRTLSEIYGDLPSPSLSDESPRDTAVSRILDTEDDMAGFGLRSTLYQYQRETVASMLITETSTQPTQNPLFLRLRAADSKCFFYQPKTAMVLREEPRVSTSSGGILCEELGTGKTVMILGLIMATRQVPSSPEASIVDSRTVYTPTSLTKFPAYNDERLRLMRRTLPFSKQHPLPSYSELLIHRALTTAESSFPNSVKRSEDSWIYQEQTRCLDMLQKSPHLAERLQLNTPFYYHTSEEANVYERSQRIAVQTSRKMYLTTASLILVPVNLLSQWHQEIHKHCEYPLRVLLLRSNDKLPDAEVLAKDYDIVLMTITRFVAERKSPDNLRRSKAQKKACQCNYILNTRIPDCICSAAGLSALLEVRWKRLVVDEGHVSASTDSSFATFARSLSVEHRWIVTGTPTTNLLGLGFGSSSEKVSNAEIVDDEDIVLDEDISSRDHDSPPQQRVWTRHDREDLRKLGSMISSFLGVEQFSAPDKPFMTQVIDALMDTEGPLPGAVQILEQVMKSVMIRHSVEDVEQDIVLPPITHESVLLDLEPLAIKSYNALQASIAVNAVDSEREDEDYLFHPKNFDLLKETMENMSQLLFWAVDERLYNIDEMLGSLPAVMQTAKQRNATTEDMILLHDASACIRTAISDPLWRSIQAHGDHLAYQVMSMSQAMFAAWTRTWVADGALRYLHGDRLTEIRNALTSRPLLREKDLLALADAVSKRDEAQTRLVEQVMMKKDLKKRRLSRVHLHARKTASSEMLEEMRQELDTAMKRLEYLETHEDASLPSSEPGSLRSEAVSLISQSPFRTIALGNSPSSKMNYIINELLQYAAHEKFLIFSCSELTLTWVGEALDLLGIKYLRFTTLVPPRVREDLVRTFETSDTYRVLLMELKHGARGLNLVTASRVIFCEPVWEADVESQAIKRVHRIGQSKPVTVKTLAIRKTAEENMICRKKAIRSNSTNKVPQLLKEAGYRRYIENPQFITEPPANLPEINLRLFNLSDTDGLEEIQEEAMQVDVESSRVWKPTANLKRVRIDLGSKDASSQEAPALKRSSMVRFAV